MSTHTAEPWKTSDYRGVNYIVHDSHGYETIIAITNEILGDWYGKFHNAHRIVECVNACAGIEKPEAVKDLVAACKRLVKEFEPEKMEAIIDDIATKLDKLEGKL